MKNIPVLKSNRIIVKPLTPDEIILYISNNNALTDKLGLLPGKRDISEALILNVHEHLLSYISSDPESIFFATVWIVADSTLNRITGHIHFKGKPDEEGMIEIGYRTYEEFKGSGYTSEAAKLMVDWAFTDNRVKMINAFTKNENIASQKILKKCGFKIHKQFSDEIEWIKKKES